MIRRVVYLTTILTRLVHAPLSPESVVIRESSPATLVATQPIPPDLTAMQIPDEGQSFSEGISIWGQLGTDPQTAYYEIEFKDHSAGPGAWASVPPAALSGFTRGYFDSSPAMCGPTSGSIRDFRSSRWALSWSTKAGTITNRLIRCRCLQAGAMSQMAESGS